MMGEFFSQPAHALERVTRDLTAEARAGRLEPVRCRDAEIARVTDILLRQGKNNPVLVGAAGVGKTAIAEGLAQRVAAGAVPLALRDARLLALDHVALLAGTMYRGQYEERLRDVVATASADPSIILFVDELHNLVGQGTAMGVAMDAANMLKPALVRGDFRVIGATTAEEYERWIRPDAALERRFQLVRVAELGAEETLDVLRARTERLERHHGVLIAPDAVDAAVKLTDLFVTDRARPDRAIDALDEACAHVQARATYSAAAEALVRERRSLLEAAVEAPGRSHPPHPQQVDVPLERFARQADVSLERAARAGIAALERFGTELEATLLGVASGHETRRETPRPARGAASPSAAELVTDARPSAPRASADAGPRARAARERLATVESELARCLMEEGVVVRAHDVARTVSAAAGVEVRWIS